MIAIAISSWGCGPSGPPIVLICGKVSIPTSDAAFVDVRFGVGPDLDELVHRLVPSAFYMGCFLLAMPAALLIRPTGHKTGFLTRLFLFGTGWSLFWPTALNASYGFFQFALFVIARGLSFLETAMNPFIAQLGDQSTLVELGPNTTIGGLLPVMAIVGGAVLTPIMGRIAESAHQIAAADAPPFISFLAIAFYSSFASKPLPARN